MSVRSLIILIISVLILTLSPKTRRLREWRQGSCACRDQPQGKRASRRILAARPTANWVSVRVPHISSCRGMNLQVFWHIFLESEKIRWNSAPPRSPSTAATYLLLVGPPLSFHLRTMNLRRGHAPRPCSTFSHATRRPRA